MIIKKTRCPLCDSKRTAEFYHRDQVPAHVNIVYHTRQEALDCPQGTISLAECYDCGLVFNTKFDNDLLNYHGEYNNDRSYSAYYEQYVQQLIDLLKVSGGISRSNILEVGSGNGEFLMGLCKATLSKGLGIDPAYKGPSKNGSVHFIPDYFKPQHVTDKMDVLLLRHILEHIGQPGTFFSDLTRHGLHKGSTIVIEVPDFSWIAERGSYWDILYEHCNYFTSKTLGNLMLLNQTSMIDVLQVFNEQYLLVFAEYLGQSATPTSTAELHFPQVFLDNVQQQKKRLDDAIADSLSKVVVWGIAGKGVTFLSALDRETLAQITFAVDMNYEKQGGYCPVTGIEIVSPEKLKSERGSYDVLVMNPNYINEIDTLLTNYGLEFNLIPL